MEREKQILQDYLLNINIADIKKKYNTSWETINKICKKHNLWNSERTIIKRKNSNNNLRKVKENPFLNLENSEVQYWLGMLATDGSIFGNKISLSSKYEYILERFRSFLKSYNSIREIYSKKFNCYYYTISFANYEIADYLKSLGIVENKTETLKVNFKLTWSFLQGVIDGDGCVSFYRNNVNKNCCSISIVTKSKEFKNQICDFYKENNIKFRNYNYNIHHIQVTNFINCKNLLKFIYIDHHTCFKHKYEKALLIRNYELKTP